MSRLEYAITPEMQAEIDQVFTFHPPHGDQVERYERIRESAKELWEEVVTLTPGSSEQTLARRSLEMFVFWANAAIARNERKKSEVDDSSEDG